MKTSDYKKRILDDRSKYILSTEDATAFINCLIEKENKIIKELEGKFALL